MYKKTPHDRLDKIQFCRHVQIFRKSQENLNQTLVFKLILTRILTEAPTVMTKAQDIVTINTSYIILSNNQLDALF
jgi:hypothetical protein